MLPETKAGIVNDQSVYWILALGGFISNNWAQIAFVACACIHAYVAFDKNRRDRNAQN